MCGSSLLSQDLTHHASYNPFPAPSKRDAVLVGFFSPTRTKNIISGPKPIGICPGVEPSTGGIAPHAGNKAHGPKTMAKGLISAKKPDGAVSKMVCSRALGTMPVFGALVSSRSSLRRARAGW